MGTEPTLAEDEARLVGYAADLADAIDAALPTWVERGLRARAGAGGVPFVAEEVGDVVDETRAVVMAEVRAVLGADVDAAGAVHSPSFVVASVR